MNDLTDELAKIVADEDYSNKFIGDFIRTNWSELEPSFRLAAKPAQLVDREALDLLQLQQRARARALRIVDADRSVSDPETLARADAYEECGNELNAILSLPPSTKSEGGAA